MASTTSGTWAATDLRLWLRRHRRRPHRDWAEWYYLAFAVVLVGSMAISLANGVDLPLLRCAPTASGCLVALDLLPYTWIGLVSLLTAAVGTIVVPIAVSAATASWLLATAVERADLLSPHLNRLVLAGLVVGVLSGMVIWLMAGSPWWIGASGAATVLAVLSAVLAQQGGGRAAIWFLVTAAIGWMAAGVVTLSEIAAVPWDAVGGTVAVGLIAWCAWRRARAGLGSMSRYSLAERGRARARLAGAASGMDAGLVLDLVTPALASTFSRPIVPASAGRLRGRPSATRGLARYSALAGYEVRRLAVRSPMLLVGLPAALVPVAFDGVLPTAGLAAATVILVVALGLTLRSVRAVHRSPGLARAIGMSARAQVAALASGAAVATLAWIACAGALLMVSGLPLADAAFLAWATGAAGLAGALRWVTVAPPDFTIGILMTDMGPAPVGALRTAFRGFDVAAVIVMLVMAGVPPWGCAVLATVALVWSCLARR